MQNQQMSEEKGIDKTMSPEEIAAYNKKLQDYLDDHLPLLRQKAEYEELLFKVDNFQYNQKIIAIKLAELKAPLEQAPKK